jgi:hypothetical protein
MTTFSDKLLSVVNHLSSHLGLVTSILDAVADRMAPKATAQASSCPPAGTYYCYELCGNSCGFNEYLVYYYYSFTPTGCSQPNFCFAGCLAGVC